MTLLERLDFSLSSREAAQLKQETILWFTLFQETHLFKLVKTISKP